VKYGAVGLRAQAQPLGFERRQGGVVHCTRRHPIAGDFQAGLHKPALLGEVTQLVLDGLLRELLPEQAEHGCLLLRMAVSFSSHCAACWFHAWAGLPLRC